MNELPLFDDKPKEECGVFAVHLPPHLDADIASMCHLGIFSLQHRGQESCGICVANGDEIRIEKDMGLVAEVFTETRLDKLRFADVRTGIGHNALLDDGFLSPLQRATHDGALE